MKRKEQKNKTEKKNRKEKQKNKTEKKNRKMVTIHFVTVHKVSRIHSIGHGKERGLLCFHDVSFDFSVYNDSSYVCSDSVVHCPQSECITTETIICIRGSLSLFGTKCQVHALVSDHRTGRSA